MALTISIEGTGVLSNAESLTGWGVSGTGSSAGLNTETYLQGSNSISSKVSGSKYSWIYYDVGSGNEKDFSTSGTEEDEFLYVWFNCSTIGGLQSKAAIGLSVRMGTDLSNFREWTLGGYDDLGNGYTGGWQCAIVNPVTTGTRDNGTYNTASVRYFGVFFEVTGSSVTDNCFVDTIALGKGLRITGTETTALQGWQEVADYCEDYSNRAWGMVQTLGQLKYLYGNMYIGDSSQTAVTDFTGSNEYLLFGDYEYWSGSAWVSALSDGFHGITIEDASSYTTTFEDGIKVGTDNGRSGSLFKGAADVDSTFDLYGGNAAGSITYLYGSKLLGINGSIDWGNDSDHECFGVTFERCDTLDPVGAVKIRNCSFVNCISGTGALKWNSSIDIQDCVFLANADSGSAGIDHWAAGTFTYTNLFFSGNGWDLYIPGSLATLVDEYNPTEDGDVDLYSGSITRVAQKFTGTAGQLTHASFSIRKQGSPTGNFYCKLYADSGGSPGSLLATSKAMDITNVTTSFTVVNAEVEFYDEYTLVASTEYHISIEYDGGDSSNRLEVEYLTAGSGSESCHTYVSSWSSQTYDCRFFVNKDGYIKINATNSNPSTYRMQLQPMGAVNIVNSVNLTITVKDESGTVIQNAQTSIYTDDSNRTELMNEDTNASGIAQESYNYTGDQAIEVRVRKASGGTNYVNFSARGTIESGGFTLLVTLKEDTINSTT